MDVPHSDRDQDARDRTQILHFVVFELGGQPYGIDVEQVEAIVEGECCEGLWSYEGQEIPVHCLTARVGLEQPPEPPSHVLVSWGDEGMQGFLVDAPRNIVPLPVDDIFSLPDLIRQVMGVTPLWGVGRSADGLFLLVDLNVAGKVKG